MADSKEMPPPPVWDPAMMQTRQRVPLSVKTVNEFVEWVGAASMADVEVVRLSIAEGCNDEIVGMLGRALNTLPIADTSRHNVLMSILGESRRESAIDPLERFTWNIVDVLAH